MGRGRARRRDASPEDNFGVYSSAEQDRWTERDGLGASERVLVQRWLRRSASTVEAGTAGGRIVRELGALGYGPLTGFDFVPEMVERARARDRWDDHTFDVEDATALSYATDLFEQGVYLQQILSLIETPAARRAAAREAHRVVRPGGVVLFSVLWADADRPTRLPRPVYRGYLSYLRALRRARGSSRSLQELPWLRLGGRANTRALRDRGPYVYWYRAEEARAMLGEVGFEILWSGPAPDLTGDHRSADGTYLLVTRVPGEDAHSSGG